MKIESPLNYTGNKFRLLDQLLPLFPEKINTFYDICCGGCSVGLNVNARNIICYDKNDHVINLLKTLKKFDTNSILETIEQIIVDFGLSYSDKYGCDEYKEYVKDNNGLKYYNQEGYLQLREYFNKTDFENYDIKSFYLYVLLMFCFNNDLRFNSKNQFNMPIGKTDFNKNKKQKLLSFKNGTENKAIDFRMADFSVLHDVKYQENDFVYIDPPYLLTTATYTENNGWNDVSEFELLDCLSYLNRNNIKFALSNVLEKNGAKNILLENWIKNNGFNVIEIKYHYSSSSYNKKDRYANEREVLVTNYDISNPKSQIHWQ
ncbi:MAG: Dam family site-specific DNA-(adenine-N6)-methyltransferase [Bacteroidales bacterium]|jgi:DNA adenine methylase Dam|nr:Dam family site-specific DNA-(adenine-N6)-methyltransferase [Bacteroidales bacterium]